MRRIILASASPRRRELLEKLGIKFEVDASNNVEEMRSGLGPHELAKAISLEKARAVARKYRDAVIIAADTFIIADGKLMGKPGSEEEARKMLGALAGRHHSVITGYTLMDTRDGKILSRAVETRVHIKRLTPREIDAYVRSKEPLDKAGAYAIQGLGSVIVEKIEGDFFNVVGLPVSALAESLKEFGVDLL